MEKFYNERGEVAVLVSPGFGAGWYSWNTDRPEILFDPELVQLVLDENYEELQAVADKKYGYHEDRVGGCYTGGVVDLVIHWLAPGTQFRIDEYDGSESLETNYDVEWSVA